MPCPRSSISNLTLEPWSFILMIISLHSSETPYLTEFSIRLSITCDNALVSQITSTSDEILLIIFRSGLFDKTELIEFLKISETPFSESSRLYSPDSIVDRFRISSKRYDSFSEFFNIALENF